MPRRRLAAVALACTLLAAIGVAEGAPRKDAAAPLRGAGALARAVRGALADPALRGARVGLLVRDLERGEVLVAQHADEALNPASGTKMLTAAAALDRIGPSHELVTSVWGTLPVQGVVASDIVLQGGGDPNLQERDLWALVGQLQLKGVREVRGALVLDASRYDHRVWPPAYDQKPSDAAYQAPISALAVGYSALRIHVQPGNAKGEAPRVSVSPGGAPVTIDNRARTTAGRGARLRISVVQGRNSDLIRVRGSIGTRHAGQSVRRRATRPTALAGAVFRQLLDRAGILVRGETRNGKTPEGLEQLATHVSRPLAELVAGMNKYSNNFMAEMLLKELAVATGTSPGSSEAGAAAVVAFLEERGVPTQGLVLANGSGLYDANRVSPRTLVGLLQVMADDPRLGPEYVGSLAVAGRDGTLRRRFRRRDSREAVERLRAKTGTLAGITSLSGYVRAADGTLLGFSLLLEDIRSLSAARRVMDEVGGALARYEHR